MKLEHKDGANRNQRKVVNKINRLLDGELISCTGILACVIEEKLPADIYSKIVFFETRDTMYAKLKTSENVNKNGEIKICRNCGYSNENSFFCKRLNIFKDYYDVCEEWITKEGK